MAYSFEPNELALLTALSDRYRSADAALAEAAALRAGLSLPKGVVHVISDVHGEDRKLRHVINNASGGLRPLVESVSGGAELSEDARRQLLNVLYYPRETMDSLRGSPDFADRARRSAWAKRTLRLQFELVRRLAQGYRREHVTSLFPAAYRELFDELLAEPCAGRGAGYVD